MSGTIINKVRTALKAAVDPRVKANYAKPFKEAIKYYGVSIPRIGTVAKATLTETKGMSKAEVFKLCEELLQSGYLEEAWLACDWAYSFAKEFERKDFDLFERWLKTYVSNWAICDTLCNHTIAACVEKFPELVERLKVWAKSENRWERRAAAVTLVLPARRGGFLRDVFEIADILLLDSDDLVQKGYGWMLKEASKAHLDEVYAYVTKNKARMPRTALRYAIEKFPEDKRKAAMRK